MSGCRVQLRRMRGYRKPAGAVVVTRVTRWGNPYRVGDPHPEHGRPMTAAEAIELYRVHLGPGGDRALDLHAVRAALAGRDLACFCPLDAPCHADVLLALAATEPPAG